MIKYSYQLKFFLLYQIELVIQTNAWVWRAFGGNEPTKKEYKIVRVRPELKAFQCSLASLMSDEESHFSSFVCVFHVITCRAKLLKNNLRRWLLWLLEFILFGGISFGFWAWNSCLALQMHNCTQHKFTKKENTTFLSVVTCVVFKSSSMGLLQEIEHVTLVSFDVILVSRINLKFLLLGGLELPQIPKQCNNFFFLGPNY